MSVTVARLRAEKPAARSSVSSYPSGHQFTPPLRPREFAARVDGQRFYEPPKRAGIVAQSDPRHAPLPGLKLTTLRNVKIPGSARPGEVLKIQAEVKGRLGNLVQASATVEVAGRIAMQSELTLVGGQ